MDQETIKKEVLAFLKANIIMSIAVCSNNKPISSILLYYVEDDFTFYFATHESSYKAKVLLENPAVSLSVWKFNDMLVQVDGTAQPIRDEHEKLAMVDKLAESASKEKDFWPPLLRIKGNDYIVFKITPTWMRQLDMKQNTISQTESPLTEITLH